MSRRRRRDARMVGQAISPSGTWIEQAISPSGTLPFWVEQAISPSGTLPFCLIFAFASSTVLYAENRGGGLDPPPHMR